MGFLFDIAKDLITDSAADIAKKVATEKGKKIASLWDLLACTLILAL